MTRAIKRSLMWGLAGLMGLACSALWAARPLNEAGLPINAGMAGSWANADIPGQGLFIDVDPANRTVFLAWFTYAMQPSPGSAIIGSTSNHWYIALGSFSEGDSSVELSLFETDGGIFDQATTVNETEVGALNLRFSACDSAEMDFLIDAGNHQGTIALMRLTSAGVCESLSGL